MNHRFLLTLSVLGGLLFSAPAPSFAADKKPAEKKAAAETPATEATSKPIPFHGKVTAVDPAAKTFSIKGKEKDRVFHFTDKSSVVGKDGQPADLAAIPVGEEVRGSAVKTGDDWEARKVTIGAKDAAPAKPAKGAKGAATPATAAKPGAPAAPSEVAPKAQ
jgi:hypothetical protein